MIYRLGAALILFLSLLGICSAKETVCLKTGFCLEADSHTLDKDLVRCRIGLGTLEIPAAQISNIEAIPDIPTEAEKSQASGGNATPEELVRQAARGQGLPADFVASVAKVESAMRQRGRISARRDRPDAANAGNGSGSWY